MLWKKTHKIVDNAVLWAEFLIKLTKYYKEEGFTETNIYEALYPAIDLFEKLLYEGVEKK